MALTDLFSFLPGWLFYLILFVAAVYLYGIWPFLTSKINLPGPKPLPFMGNLGDLAKRGPVATDEDNVKKYGPVHVFWMGRRAFIHAADPEIVKQVSIKDFPNFVNRPTGVPLSKFQKLFISVVDDDHWKFIRSVLSPAFTSGKMKGMVPLIQNCTNRLQEALSAKAKTGESFNIQPVFECLSLEVISAAAFGIDVDAHNKKDDVFLGHCRKMFDRNVFASIPLMVGLFFPFTIRIFEAFNWTVSINESSRYLREVLAKSIREKKTGSSDRKDLLQIMLDNSLDTCSLSETKEDTGMDTGALTIENLRRQNKMTDDEIMAQAIILLLAGYKTTSSALSFMAYNLAVYSECQEKLMQEIDENLKGETPTYNNVMTLPYLDMCLAETQRLYPAITGTVRVARSSTLVNGHFIPKGVAVKMMNYIMHRDPQYWPDPEKFIPERFTPEAKAQRNPYVYFPFGLGPRNCVGMRMAQLEAKLAIVSILQKFKLARCPETQVPLKLRAIDHLEAENGIWVKVIPRDH